MCSWGGIVRKDEPGIQPDAQPHRVAYWCSDIKPNRQADRQRERSLISGILVIQPKSIQAVLSHGGLVLKPAWLYSYMRQPSMHLSIYHLTDLSTRWCTTGTVGKPQATGFSLLQFRRLASPTKSTIIAVHQTQPSYSIYSTENHPMQTSKQAKENKQIIIIQNRDKEGKEKRKPTSFQSPRFITHTPPHILNSTCHFETKLCHSLAA